MRGEANHSAKLVEEDIPLILELYYESKLSLQTIADKFEVSKTQIWRIVSRKQWTHVSTEYGQNG